MIRSLEIIDTLTVAGADPYSASDKVRDIEWADIPRAVVAFGPIGFVYLGNGSWKQL